MNIIELPTLDLFSGIGAFALGTHAASTVVSPDRSFGVRYKTVGLCEINKPCQHLLKARYPGTPIFPNIKRLNKQLLADHGIESVSVLTGGYPCQDLSVAGKREGEKGARWLWPWMASLISELRPTLVFAENVAGHRTAGLDTVLRDLEEMGYAWDACCIPAASLFAPHKRDRIWITARRIDAVAPYNNALGCERGSIGRQSQSSYAKDSDGLILGPPVAAPAYSIGQPHTGESGHDGRPQHQPDRSVADVRSFPATAPIGYANGQRQPQQKGAFQEERQRHIHTIGDCIDEIASDSIGDIGSRSGRPWQWRGQSANRLVEVARMAWRRPWPMQARSVCGLVTKNGRHSGWFYNPSFGEWMMGLPDGWTNLGLSKRGKPILSNTTRIKMIGNSLVPQIPARICRAMLVSELSCDPQFR